MSKQFGNFEKNLIRKESIPAVPKTEDEIRPFLAQRDRDEREKMAGDEMSPKDFNVWIVETEASQGIRQVDEGAPLLPAYVQPEAVKGREDSADRFVHVTTIPQRDVRKTLPYIYLGRGEISSNMVPDLVVVSGGVMYTDNDIPREKGSHLARKYLEYETDVIREIRKAADSALYFPEIESGDPLKDGTTHQFLDSDILGDVHFSNQFGKHEITDELVFENICSRLFKTDSDWDMAPKMFDEYARTGEDELLKKLVTPGRVRRAVEYESRYSPNWFREALGERKKYISKENGFANDDEALQYHKDVVEHTRHLAATRRPEELQERVFETLKKLIDAKKDEYLYDVEFDAAERKLLQPLIVATGPSELFLNAALEAGADAVLKDISPEDMQKLVALANVIRTSPASISADRLRRNKNDFYRSVADQIEDRSNQTADTGQELSLLKSVFEKNDAKKILDVGSGYGRLLLPLVESGYDVTGLETNRVFLEKAKASAGKSRRAHFKKGDLIHYENIVKREGYDAIYYGWHSFLEAYGLGNSLATLRSARMALKPGGTVTFDQPSRENPGLEDGWYGDEDHGYLAYLMNEDELKFVLRLAGFENVEIVSWTTKPSELYPEGMKKITVTAQKPKFSLPADTKEKAPK